MDELYRGWAGGRGVGGRWEAEGGQYHPQGDKQQCYVFSRAQKLPHAVKLVGRDDHQQQFDIPSSLISAHQWPHRPCSGPSWFYRVGKRPHVKADLAIYSLIVGMSGQWLNVVTMLNNKLDFYCCDNSVSFCNPITYTNIHTHVHTYTCINTHLTI